MALNYLFLFLGVFWDVTTTDDCYKIDGWCSEDYCPISPMEAGVCDNGEFCCSG